MRRLMFSLLGCALLVLAAAAPAAACGGLVAPNGAVRLAQTTTLAAYHDGIEHYVTSFVYQGAQGSFGSIIPLPGVPTDVRRAGSWTLQRLERETHPAPEEFATTAAAAAAPAQVLLQTTVDALDITVLAGGGQAVVDWVKAHGFAVSPDAPAVLDFYARRSPVFLAARFDASAAAARHQVAGDGTPVQITVPTPNPWVPLHILSLAKPAADVLQADVYLLTDRAPALLGLDDGVSVQLSEPASSSLLTDLRSDKDSGWVPDTAWLTFVRVDTPAAQLVHDLAVDVSGAGRPSVTQAGYDPLLPTPSPVLAATVHPAGAGRGARVAWAVPLGALAVAACTAAIASGRKRRVSGR
ncbi:MAG TPA: DUF2330 domain-containing protein [Acidimicrobiales bacterium]|nr:DUF2330 domain-containing protein [Acidimicrobiales bacterium]